MKKETSVLMGKIHSTAYCAYGSWCCGLCTGCVSMCLGLYYTQAYMKEVINYDTLQERRKRMNEAYMAHLYDENFLTGTDPPPLLMYPTSHRYSSIILWFFDHTHCNRDRYTNRPVPFFSIGTLCFHLFITTIYLT